MMESKPRLIVVGSASERRTELALTMRIASIFEVVEAASGLETIRLVNERATVAVVCVWPLRGRQVGLDLLRFLRSNDERLLIAVVGVRVETWGVREVLRAGADLYFPNPFDLDLVAAHMEMGIRRRSVPESKLRAGDLMVDVSGHQAWRGEVELSLTPSEFRLLVSLVQHVGEVVSKGVLLRECWRRHDDPGGGGGHLVEVHTTALRHKLHACGLPILHTVYGVGYVIRPQGAVNALSRKPAQDERPPQ
jgi:two-component system OmpR family response regulator